MTMLTHRGGQFKTIHYSSGTGDNAGTDATNPRLATIRRFWMCALTCLIIGGAVAGIVALKTIIYLSRMNY